MRFFPSSRLFVTSAGPGTVPISTSPEAQRMLKRVEVRHLANGGVQFAAPQPPALNASLVLQRIGDLRRTLDGNARRLAWLAKRQAANPHELTCSAFHEAGHAVVAGALRQAVERVELDPARTTLARGRSSPADRIAVALAGAIAEGKYVGDDNPQFDGSDAVIFDEAMDLLSADGRCRQSIQEHAAGKAMSILERRWRTVQRVAAALVEEGRLGGAAVRKLMRP